MTTHFITIYLIHNIRFANSFIIYLLNFSITFPLSLNNNKPQKYFKISIVL